MEFTDTEIGLYQYLMQSYTEKIGENLGEPFVISYCTVTEQRVGIYRERRTKGSSLRYGERNAQEELEPSENVLSVTFSMNYTSRYGIDVTVDGWNYPQLLLSHLNENTTAITLDMQNLFLANVVEVGDTFMSLFLPPTNSPTNAVVTAKPSPFRTLSPTSLPSIAPSYFPSEAPTIPKVESRVLAFVLGTLFGVLGAAAVSYFIYYRHTKNHPKQRNVNVEVHSQEEKHPVNDDNNVNNIGDGVATAVPAIDKVENNVEEHPSEMEKTLQQSDVNNHAAMMPQASTPVNEEDENFVPSSTTAQVSYNSATIDSMMTIDSPIVGDSPGSESMQMSPYSQYYSKKSNDAVSFVANLMVTREDSFSSDSDDEILSPREPDREKPDEFDKYRCETLEQLRTEVEDTIANVDGMMSLAMTKIFTEMGRVELDLTWVGAEDLGSIEASCFCETLEWTKQHERTICDTA